MKRILTIAIIFFGTIYFTVAQVLIDKPLQMTGGSGSDRRITNLGNPVAEDDAVSAGTIQKNMLTYAGAIGSNGTFVVNLTPPPGTYSPGMIVNFKSNHTIAGPATLQVGSLAAISIKKGVVNDLASGDIINDQIVSVIFDGNNFQLISGTPAPTSLPPSGSAGGDLTGSYPNPHIATNAVTANEIANATIEAADLAPTGVGAGTYNSVTVNMQGQVTAGTVVPYLTGEVDGSVSNEGLLSVGAGAATTALIQSNTSGSSPVTLTAGTGLSIAENTGMGTITFTNSNPDQTVTITGGGINSVSGAYPNFTITATEVDGSTTNEGALSVEAGTSTTAIVRSSPNNSFVRFTAGTGIGITETTGANGNISFTAADPSLTNEGSLSVGAGTATTSLIQSNTSGSATISLVAGDGTTLSESGNNITINSNYKTKFIHWGQATCPATSTLIYSGYAASGHYDHGGSGRNYLCLTDAPSWSGTTTPGTGTHSIGLLYGLEFETGASDNNAIPGFNTRNNREALCAACLVNAASVTLMIPGTTLCPADWTRQYWGYLMSTRYNQGGSEFVCVVNNPTVFGSTTNSDGALWYAVEYRTGALAGTYATHNGREAVCAVCTQ